MLSKRNKSKTSKEKQKKLNNKLMILLMKTPRVQKSSKNLSRESRSSKIKPKLKKIKSKMKRKKSTILITLITSLEKTSKTLRNN